jgi:intraflagellar transport protein 140
MAGEHIFLAEGPRVDVTNLSGVVKQTLSFTDIEGDPTLLDVNPGGTHMAVVTARGMLKIFKVSRREAKQVGSGIALLEAIDSDADTRRTTRGGASVRGRPKIRSIRCNANGTRVSVLVDRSLNAFHTDVDTRIYVYNSDQSSVQSFEFGPDRRPTSHLWDGDEPRLLVVEASALRAPGLEATESVGIRDTEASAKGVEDSDVKEGNVSKTCADGARARFRSKTGETRALKKLRQAAKVQIMINRAAGVGVDQAIVATLFATSEHGILQQDSFPIERLRLSLMGLRVPYLYFIVASDASKGGAGKNIRESEGRAPNCERRLRSRLMRDFVGLDRVDDRTKRALLDFSYHLTTGNMDEAYRAVKLIQSPSVWENMAHMCVKTKRLDVAEVCLGNMGHARGAKAVREAKSRHPEIEARIAMVAVQLGLLEDAERLYAECGRHDLLNELFQASGQWKEALDIAETQDRIHLRCTHYLYAKHLEAIGDDAGAISHYEAAQAHRHEVPRMLFDRGRVEDLERYVKRSGDPKLFRWWAQYCESSGDLDAAMKYYQRAGDTLSQVRIHCFRRCFDDAAEAAFMAGPQDKAAAYHLARQHEQHGNIKEAINFYTRAGRYNHAVRIAKRAGLDEELAQLASVSPKDAQADAARHFEQSGRFDEAVRLYNRAGQMDRALELCFREKLFESMRQITEQLASDDPDGDGDPRTQANPLVLARCAEFFLDHGEYEKAVLVSIAAGKPDRALELCAEHRVKITDEIADRLAPPKKRRSDGPGWKEHNLQRAKLLAAAARVCKKQQSFHLACKLYTQAGDRMKALASLLKSGDTEKIIFFASVSRSRDVYVLVANWLQNLDWRNDTKIMKAIIQFYTKSRAFSQLAGFYEACAQIEIDEYRDYDRALGAIKDALKYLSKIKGREQKAQSEGKIVELKKRADLMEDFLAAKRSIKTDPEETVRACEELLARPEVDKGIRSGDVYALLIEFYFAADNMESAMDLVDRFMATPSGRKTSWSENPYLKADMLRKILEANGRDWPGARRFDTGPEGGKKHGSDGSSGELSDASMEEEIGEDSELNMNRSIGVDDEGGSFHGTMATYEGK